MPKSWAKTYIVLIPKKDKPKLVSNYHPISLCNVCFKIITKILTNHLQNIIPNLIGKEQVDFVPGHCSFDNIITAQELLILLKMIL